ncbi:hypothetical protein PIB30_040843 [Stylosanthes scabra]|uniref:Glutaredoxin domain-containing protein n=1 Tax=Stylosanthes scabra TaxID=79078 RepID=A0ABU6YGP6_9FABA|nr:hypothetical protein [Stylosanthes scabra]
MWRSWSTNNNSTLRISSPSSSSPSYSPSPSHLFSCSSFKDVESLCFEDSPPYQNNTPQLSLSPRASSVFHRVKLANSLVRSWSTHSQQQQPQLQPPPPPQQQQQQQQPPPPQPQQPPHKPPRGITLPSPKAEEKHHTKHNTENALYLPGTEQRVVVYFTSLRVVRNTFKSCRTVLSILTGFRVPIDERDVSMDSSFLIELGQIMGPEGPNQLPRVFIGGKYVGGEDEVIMMNETGELKKLLKGLPKATGECNVCAGQRFVLCDECDGSRKLYTEENNGDGGEFITCVKCNENGLLKCPACFAESSPVFSS